MLNHPRENAQRLLAMMAATSDIIWIGDASGRFNPAARQSTWGAFTGQAPEEAAGDGWKQKVHPEDLSLLEFSWHRILASRGRGEQEYRILRNDGQWRYIHAKSVPVKNQQGVIEEWLGLLTDITDRKIKELEKDELIIKLKEKEQQLQSHEEDLRQSLKEQYKLNALLDQQRQMLQMSQQISKLGSWVYDVVSKEMTWSDETYQIYEVAPSVFPSLRLLYDTLGSSQGILFRNCLEDMIRHNRRDDFTLVLQYTTPKGIDKYLTNTASPECDQKGHVIRIYGSVQDITDAKLSEQKLKHGLELELKLNHTLATREAELSSSEEEMRQINDQLHKSYQKLDENNRLLLMSQQIAKIGSWHIAPETGILNLTPEQYNTLGLDSQKIYSITDFFRLLPRNEADYLFSILQNKEKNKYSEYSFEFWHQPSGSQSKYLKNQISIYYHPNGKVKEVYGVTQDVTSIKIAQENLRKREELLNLTGQTTKVAGWERDIATNTYFLTDQMYIIRDLEVGADLTMSNTYQFYKPVHAKILKQALINLEKEGTPFDHELPLTTAKGRNIWVRSLGKAEWQDGKIARLYGSMQDITERKIAELQLAATLNFQNTLFNAADYAIISTDTHGIITLFNAAAEQMLGYTAEEMVGILKPDSFHDWQELEAAAEQISKETGRLIRPGMEVFQEKTKMGVKNEREWTYIRKDGTRFPVSLTISPVYDQKSQLIGYLGMAKDISGQKLKEEQLRKQKALTDALIRNLPFNIWARDTDQKIIFRNDHDLNKWKSELGHTPDDANVSDEIKQIWKENNKRVLKGEIINRIRPYEFNNSVSYVNEIIAPVWDHDNIIAIIGANIDITDLKNKELQLKEALEEEQKLNEELSQREEEIATREEELRTSFEELNHTFLLLRNSERMLKISQQIAKLGSWELDLSTDQIKWSEQVYQLYGLSTDFELNYETFRTLHTPEVMALFEAKTEYSILCKEPFQMEYRYFLPNGMYKDMLAIGYPSLDAKEEVVCFSGSIQDITERKIIEESMRISQQLLKETGRMAKVGGWELDLATEQIRWTDATYEIHEVNLYTTIDKATSIAFYTEEHQPVIRQLIQNAIESGKSADAELQIITGSGNKKWIRIIIHPDYRNTKIYRLFGAIQDITEHKISDEKIRSSENLLNSIIENIPIGILVLDAEGRVKKMNQANKTNTGLPPDYEPNGQFELISDQLIVRSDLVRYFRRASAGEIIINEEIFVDFGSGDNSWSTRNDKAWFALTIFAIFNGDQVASVIAVTQDITADKLNEIKIREHTRELIESNKKTANYKLMALRSVMNPHFLFNSLNSIQSFIATNERVQALNYLSLFSKLIRSILNSSIENANTIAEEIEILKLYIGLERLRFDNKFEAEFYVDPALDIENIEIPSLILQPYVENSILHGLYSKDGHTGRIKISFKMHHRKLLITIEDNGIGRKAAMEIKQANKLYKSVGMLVTQERLELINKDNALSVNIADLTDKYGQPAGTKVEIYINQS